jgi:hypothetical protein
VQLAVNRFATYKTLTLQFPAGFTGLLPARQTERLG